MQASIAKGHHQQFRKTFKNGLGVMLSRAFRRRGNVEAEEEILDCLSELNSECSTLVDFAMHEPDATTPTLDNLESLNDLLDEDNQAWTPRSFGTTAAISVTQGCAFGLASASTQAISQTSLLDEDDCSWVMPRKSAQISSSAGRKRRSLKKYKFHARTPLSWQSTELLDPEERSWM
ncbi:hypothetical protein M0805_003281 [Coniferiporia weirii]|nr:hypothetical protein M0805_003281 [Coniferiporia weirii]